MLSSLHSSNQNLARQTYHVITFKKHFVAFYVKLIGSKSSKCSTWDCDLCKRVRIQKHHLVLIIMTFNRRPCGSTLIETAQLKLLTITMIHSTNGVVACALFFLCKNSVILIKWPLKSCQVTNKYIKYNLNTLFIFIFFLFLFFIQVVCIYTPIDGSINLIMIFINMYVEFSFKFYVLLITL